MKRKVATILIVILSCLSFLNIQAKYIDDNTYRIEENDIFIDVENMNVKKIVTEVCDDGSFVAKDLAEWIKEQDFYCVTEIKSCGETCLLYYELNMNEEEKTEEINSMNFENLVIENDIIKFSDSTMEKVVLNAGGGNFFTEVSESYFLR